MAIDTRQLKRWERDTRKLAAAMTRAEARAMNKAAITVRKDAVTEIRQVLNLKAKDVRENIRITKASPSRFTVSFSSRLVGVPITTGGSSKPHFKGRQIKAGISYKPFRTSGRTTIKGGFAHSTLAGGRAFKRRGRERLPIKQLYGPSVQSVFRRKQVQAAMDAAWARRLETTLRQEENFELKKAGYR